MSKDRRSIFDTGSEPERARSTYGAAVARTRKQLDLRAVAEALTDPSRERADMDAIAAHLGVAKPTLYRMAGSRDELVALSIDAEAERLLEAVHRAGLAGLFEFAVAAPAGFRLLFGGRYPEARPAVRRVESRVRDRIARVPGTPPADPGLASAGLVAMAAQIALRIADDDKPADVERLRSAFDGVAKAAAEISDMASMEAAEIRA
jgi:AcrR family transcriptional regulator